MPSRFWHRRILSGRLPDPARPGEVNISFTLAQTAHLGAGDILRDHAADSGRPAGAVRVPDRRDRRGPVRIPAADRHGHRHGLGDPGLLPGAPLRPRQVAGVALRLRHGAADLPAVQREMGRLAGGKFVQSYPLATQAVNTERSIHLQAVALWLVAALLAVISLLVLGQLLARMSFLDSVEYRTLRALGISRRILLAIGLLRAAVIGAAGAAAGALAALAISPLLPVGLAARGRAVPGDARRRPGLRPRGGRRGADHDGRDRLADLAGGERRTAVRLGARPRPARRSPETAVPGPADLRNRLGHRDARHPAGAAARRGPDRGAGAQHRGQRGGGRGRAHRGAGLLGQPGASAGHARGCTA